MAKLTLKETAARLGMRPRDLHIAIRAVGALPYTCDSWGGSVRFEEADVDAYIAHRELSNFDYYRGLWPYQRTA
jgi:hypothetical protein